VSFVDLLPLAALAGVLGLDVVSFPQAMVSRPVVAAALGGAFAGHAEYGLLAGVVLELLALEMLPVGASRYPEWGSASVVAGALAGDSGTATPATIPVAALVGLVTALVGGWSMVQLRKWNGNWARVRLPALQRGSYRTVVGLQLYGMTADLLRGAVLALVALLLSRPLLAAVAARWGLGAVPSLAVVVSTVAIVAVAALWRRTSGDDVARRLFVAGLALGGIVAWLR